MMSVATYFFEISQRPFADVDTLEPPRRTDSAYFPCTKCGLLYPIQSSLEEHWMKSPNHGWCDHCHTCFDSKDEAMEHKLKEHTYYCPFCPVVYLGTAGLIDHLQSTHNYCVECQRSFQSNNNLRAHLNSKRHMPQLFKCPGEGCDQSFISIAALTLHFESGTCKSGVTKEAIDRLALNLDKNHCITNPERLLQYKDAANTRTWATERSFNGTAYECFLCHATFPQLIRLNAHLKSPVHDAKIYRCPNLDCRKEYAAMSSLCQHVESGKCGLLQFRQVKDAFDGLVSKVKQITV